MKAMEAIKAVKAKQRATCPRFGPRGSIRYDARTYRLMSLDRVSLNTLEGRVVSVAWCWERARTRCWVIRRGRSGGEGRSGLAIRQFLPACDAAPRSPAGGGAGRRRAGGGSGHPDTPRGLKPHGFSGYASAGMIVSSPHVSAWR